MDTFVMTKARRWDNSEWPEWLHEAWNHGAGENGLWCDDEKPNDQLYLGTDEGVYLVQWGDTLVLGIDKSINYEPVEHRAERLEFELIDTRRLLQERVQQVAEIVGEVRKLRDWFEKDYGPSSNAPEIGGGRG